MRFRPFSNTSRDNKMRRFHSVNTQRAKEIATSPVMANVTLNEVPVYIQHVDEETNMARVYPLDDPDQEESVPVDSLLEHS